MLRFVIGPAMSGKTRYMQNAAAQVGEFPATLLLVPEQFVFQTEQMLLRLGGADVVRRCEVLSLTRLARKLGADGCKAADDAAKQALMRLGILQVLDGLEFYKKQALRPDFAALAVELQKRFKKAGLSPEKLAELALRVRDPRLKAKLNDFYLIYASCRQVMGDRYFDPDDNLTRLCELLRRDNPYRGARILVDSFSDFNAAEYEVLRLLMAGAAEFWVSLDGDEKHFMADNGPDELFAIPNHTAARLLEFAKSDGVKQGPTVFLGAPRYNNAALAAAEAAFRTDAKKPLPGEGVALHICANQQSEARRLAENIANLVRDTGWRYDDIAVICRNPDSWRGLADRALTDCDIPFFWDRRKPLSGTPLCRFLLLALSVCNEGDAEALGGCLKSGFFNMSTEQVCRLENYAFENGKKSRADWCAQWQDPEIESLRAAVMTPLDNLAEATKTCSPREFAKAVYDFTEAVDVKSRLTELSALERLPRLEAVMTDPLRSYNSIIMLLDSFVSALDLPGVQLAAAQYADIFALMASTVTIGEIPQYIDAVHFGGAGLIRTANPKAVFILGANRDIFPAPCGDPTPFTLQENRTLAALDAELDKDPDATAAAEQLLVYSCCFCASDRLTVSCSRSDSAGKTDLYPSDFFTFLSDLAPDCVFDEYSIPFERRAVNPTQAATLLPSADRRQRRALLAALRQSGSAELARSIERASMRSDERRAAEMAPLLFGGGVRLSASRVEDFIKCRFRYFCSSVLRINKLRPTELDGSRFGTAYHTVLQYMLEKYRRPGEISAMDAQKLGDEIHRLLVREQPQLFVKDQATDGRAVFFNTRLEQMVRADLVRLDTILAGEQFRPDAFEVKLGEQNTSPLKLPGAVELEIGGLPDRVDCYTDAEGVRWLRAIDYKTGEQKSVTEKSLREGLNLQLVFYLQALCESKRYEGARPAGFYYCFMKGDGNFRMNGLREDNDALIPAFGDLKGNCVSGGPRTGKADMRAVFDIADGAALKMADELSKGIFDAVPRSGGDCKFCDFSSVCYSSKTAGEGDTADA